MVFRNPVVDPEGFGETVVVRVLSQEVDDSSPVRTASGTSEDILEKALPGCL